VVNPYARPSPARSSDNPGVVPSASTPNTGHIANTPDTGRNASGRLVRLSGASQRSFNVGDRVDIINDLYSTLRRTTDIKDYQGTGIDVTPCTVLIRTDSAVTVRKYFKSIIKIE